MLEPARFIETLPARSVTADGPLYKVNLGKKLHRYPAGKGQTAGTDPNDPAGKGQTAGTDPNEDLPQRCRHPGKNP
jgi:hypothetical protein